MSAKRLGSRLIMKYQGKTYESAWCPLTVDELTDETLSLIANSAASNFKSEQGGRIVIGREVLRRAVFIVKECYEPCCEPVPAASEADKEEGE